MGIAMSTGKKSSISIPTYTALYVELYTKLDTELSALQSRREKFPQKFMETVNFEDFTLEASNLKHEAIKLNKAVLTLHTNAEIDCDYLTSYVLLSKAEETLKDYGYEKITDSLRSAAVASNKDLNDFLKIVGKVKALHESVKALPRAFETDETNQRIFSGYNRKISGF